MLRSKACAFASDGRKADRHNVNNELRLCLNIFIEHTWFSQGPIHIFAVWWSDVNITTVGRTTAGSGAIDCHSVEKHASLFSYRSFFRRKARRAPLLILAMLIIHRERCHRLINEPHIDSLVSSHPWLLAILKLPLFYRFHPRFIAGSAMKIIIKIIKI